MVKERAHGIDAVRTAAIMFVVVLHAVSISGILDQQMSLRWGVALYARHLTLACVPLFLMLTGYLQSRKTFCVRYYRSIIPLIVSYAAINLLCVIARWWLEGEVFYWKNAVYSMFNFTANEYAWYFEMYIGLFLLIPFLNMVYQGIRTRAGKHILLASLAILTLLPDTLAGFSPYYNGSGSTVALDIVPDFFKSMYPITFYFLGCYIAEYKPKLVGARKLVVLCAPVLPAGLVVLYTYVRSWYAWYLCNGFQTITVAITAVCVFVVLYDIEIKSEPMRKAAEQIALCTFELYLLSYLWDSLVYSVAALHTRLPLAVTASIVFFGSFLSAWLLRLCLRPASKILLRVYDRIFGDKVGEM